MIVYSANKRLFVQDVKSNQIATKILSLIRERGLNAGQDREFAAWQNSMNFMRNIVDDPEIDDDVQIAIEYIEIRQIITSLALVCHAFHVETELYF